MRHALLLAGLFWFAPVAKAQELSAEESVETLVHGTMNCIPGEPNPLLTYVQARVRRDPQTHLPLLKAWVSLERIDEATRDKAQIEPIENAIRSLARLGGDEGRMFLVERLSQFQRYREELAGQMKTRAPRPGTTLAPEEKDAWDDLVRHRNLSERMEFRIVESFTEAADPRLRDHLLRRLDQEQDCGQFARYIDYFSATAREDPKVRARLEALLETSDFSLTREALRRFFTGW